MNKMSKTTIYLHLYIYILNIGHVIIYSSLRFDFDFIDFITSIKHLNLPYVSFFLPEQPKRRTCVLDSEGISYVLVKAK